MVLDHPAQHPLGNKNESVDNEQNQDNVGYWAAIRASARAIRRLIQGVMFPADREKLLKNL